MTFEAYGVTSLGLDIQQLSMKQRALDDDELLLQTLYCGVCASDIHQMTGGWNGFGLNLVDNNTEGLCCGHEAISIVIGKGPRASEDFKIGDIVGCGPQRNCLCNKKKATEELCSLCEVFQEQLCLKGVEKLYSRDFTGGFGSILQCAEKFCFKIPDGMDLLRAAPLCCAGLTTFAPLQQFTKTLPKNAKVGVIGIGGLGLMAIQYALKMEPIGEVFAFTTSKVSKEADLLQLGCHGVIDYKTEDMAQYKNKFDLIINTVSQSINIDLFLSCVKPLGELNCLGVGSDPLVLNPFALISNKRISSSFIGGTKSFVDMLNFSHQHNIYPICESVKVPFNGENAEIVADALKRVERGEVRYRMVLDYCVDIEAVTKKALEAAAA